MGLKSRELKKFEMNSYRSVANLLPDGRDWQNSIKAVKGALKPSIQIQFMDYK